MAWHWKAVSAVASMEQAIVPDLRRVLRSFRIECLERDMGDGQKRLADEWINQHFVFLQPGEDEDMTLPWLLERFAAARQRHGAGIGVIDPWNEVSIVDKPVDWTAEQWISQACARSSGSPAQHDMTIIIVAHPRKLGRDQERQGAQADAVGYCRQRSLGQPLRPRRGRLPT